MPLYQFICSACAEQTRKILDAGKQKEKHACKCGGELLRDASAPSTQTMETLDNGLMVRRIERLKDAEELYHDRAKQGPRNE